MTSNACCGIVIYENSPKEFKKLLKIYYHYSKQVFDTGLELNLIQEFIMLSLDIFRKNMDNKNIETRLETWLTFLTNDKYVLRRITNNGSKYREVYDRRTGSTDGRADATIFYIR